MSREQSKMEQPLKKLKNLKEDEDKIEAEIKNKIKNIFEEEDSIDGLRYIQIFKKDLWINLSEGCLIPTTIFSELDKYFNCKGYLSYSTGDGFVISYDY